MLNILQQGARLISGALTQEMKPSWITDLSLLPWDLFGVHVPIKIFISQSQAVFHITLRKTSLSTKENVLYKTRDETHTKASHINLHSLNSHSKSNPAYFLNGPTTTCG